MLDRIIKTKKKIFGMENINDEIQKYFMKIYYLSFNHLARDPAVDAGPVGLGDEGGGESELGPGGEGDDGHLVPGGQRGDQPADSGRD